MHKLTSLLAGLLSLAVAFPAAAADLLFRADQQPPGIIFAQGFQPSAPNMNLLDHASGASCFMGASNVLPSERRTAYIGLSDSPHLTAPYEYVYRVTPDSRAEEATAAFNIVSGLDHTLTVQQALNLDVRQLAA